MKLTIGMASYNNFDQVWFTIQALRLYQDLTDTEILVVDNFGDDNLKSFCESWTDGCCRYVRFTEIQGTAAPRNKVFEEAQGEWVVCIDSHVMLPPGTIKRIRNWGDSHPNCKDLFHGPLLYDDLRNMADAWNPIWGSGMWGQWRGANVNDEHDTYEIEMNGLGLFGCRKDAWLGFNPSFRGFGGEEGYIHEKFRKAGHKVICLPFLKWVHKFATPGKIPYTPLRDDMKNNYEIGFTELGLDKTDFYREYGIPIPELLPQPSVKISCIMITYRRMTCVERSISMWCEQTFKDSELIIFNTDPDYPITLGSSLSQYNIRVINNAYDYQTKQLYNNVGAIRRDSLTHALGEYYICWDDDDIFLAWNNQQCFDRILDQPDIWAWKPEKSMCKLGGKDIELAENTMEASIIARVDRIREFGFIPHLGGGEHLSWIQGFGEHLKVDSYSVPGYSFNWSDPSDIGGHKQSSSIDAEDNFERHKRETKDKHTRPMELINVSNVIAEYKTFLQNQSGLYPELVEWYVK